MDLYSFSKNRDNKLKIIYNKEKEDKLWHTSTV